MGRVLKKQVNQEDNRVNEGSIRKEIGKKKQRREKREA